MAKTFTFEQQMVIKTIADDIRYEIANVGYVYKRKIRPAAYAEKAMENLATSLKFQLANNAKVINECIENYKNAFKFEGDAKSVIEALDKDFRELIDDNYKLSGTPIGCISTFTSSVRDILKECDKIVEFTQMAYRTTEQKDHRFGDIDIKEILKDSHNVLSVDLSEKSIFDKIEEELPKGTDIYSQEFGKNICKKVRAFKAMTISTLNKYFGKNSKLADLGIVDIALM